MRLAIVGVLVVQLVFDSVIRHNSTGITMATWSCVHVAKHGS